MIKLEIFTTLGTMQLLFIFHICLVVVHAFHSERDFSGPNSLIQPDQPPRHAQYEVSRFFEFYQFDAKAGKYATTYKYWVLNTILDVMQIMQNAADILDADSVTGQPPSNPSFNRYFYAQDLVPVRDVLRRLLAAIGAPGLEMLRISCISNLPKLAIFFDDPPWIQPSDTASCSHPDLPAYQSYMTNT